MYVLRGLRENVLHDVCPNCGGGFAPRPIRPHGEWRKGSGLMHDRPSERRRTIAYTRVELAAFSAMLKDLPLADR